jgi:hypothetical protein
VQGQGVQLKEGVGDLEHENVRVTMIVYDEDAFNCAAHSKILIVILETLKTSRDGWIFLRLCLFGTDSRMSAEGVRGACSDTHLKVKFERG